MPQKQKFLEQFRDMELSKEQLYELIPKNTLIIHPVIVRTENLIRLLEEYQQGLVSEKVILDWVNIIWFSDWYDYFDEHSDSIASVMNELEEIDEIGKELTPEKVSRCILALKQNVEL